MDHISILKISSPSDCSKHAQATVWLPWGGFHDSQQDLLQRTQENPKPIKNTQQKELCTGKNKKKPTTCITYYKEKVEEKEASLFLNLHILNQKTFFQRKGKG